MISKAELRQQIADLQQEIANRDERLAVMQHRLAKYFPFADDLESIFDTLTKMGLEGRIREILLVGQVHIFEDLTNPDNGEAIAAHYTKVSLEKDKESGHYEIYVEGKPYSEFFAEEHIQRAELDRLAKENPMVKEIFEENARMRQVLKITRKD